MIFKLLSVIAGAIIKATDSEFINNSHVLENTVEVEEDGILKIYFPDD